MLAFFGERMRPSPRRSRSAAGLVLRRRQLVPIRDAERNRCRRISDAALRRSLDDHLAWLGREIERLEGLIAEQVEHRAESRSHAVSRRSVPGIGPVTAACLLALLPELVRLSAKAVASLAGWPRSPATVGWVMRGHPRPCAGRCATRFARRF